MNLSPYRRILIVITAFLWLASLWCLVKYKNPASTVKLNQRFKVRACSVNREKAHDVLKLGKELGFSGSIVKGTRTINKYMGYCVYQELIDTGDRKKLHAVLDFLKSRGYSANLVRTEEKETVILKLKQNFARESDARKTADDLSDLTQVHFSVRKDYRNAGFKAFITVFQGIGDRETAENLKESIKRINSDVETVVY